MTETSPALRNLTDDEANFVYNVEVLGLPAKKAAQLAGMRATKIPAPHIQQARELLKRELRGALQITREDVAHGYQEAIHMARIQSDALTMIIGWEKTAKLLGLDAPARVDVNVRTSMDVAKELVRGMTDAELIQQLGAEAVIDGEFYEAKQAQV